mgnify:CR=1 FL=1
MLRFRKDSTPADRPANRLVSIGLALLLIPPCLLTALVGLIVGPAGAAALLPRDQQPVAAARDGEMLALVADFNGSGGSDPAARIDKATLDYVLNGYWSGTLRVGRVDAAPASHEQALALAAPYRAALVVWGTYDSQSITVHLSMQEDHDPLNIPELVLTLDSAYPGHLDALGGLAAGLLLSQAADDPNNSYYSYDAITALESAYNSGVPALRDPVIALYLAHAYYKSGNLTAALTALDGALLGENLPLIEIHLLRASIASDLGQYGDALESAGQALALAPERSDVVAVYAGLLVNMGRYAEAEQAVAASLQANPQDSALLAVRARARSGLGQYAQALADYELLAEIAPDEVDYHIERSDVLIALGRTSAALDALEDATSALARSDYYDEARLIKIGQLEARLLISAQRFDEALDVYRRMPSYTPEYRFGTGMIAWERGDHEAAFAAWDAALDTMSSDAYALNELAWELALRGYFEGALPYAERALSFSPSDDHIRHTRAFVLLGLGRYSEALVDFEIVERNGLGSFYTGLYRDMADTYLGLERYDEAIRSYNLYLDSTYNAADTAQVLQRLEQARAARDSQ